MGKNHWLLRVCPSVDQTVVSGAKSLSKNKPIKTYSSEWCLSSVALEFYEAVNILP